MRRFLAALALAGLMPLAATAGDPTVDFAPDDPEMRAAISAARATLDDFLARHAAAADRSSHAVKVAVPATGDVAFEHIWMVDLVETAPGAFEATVANEPNWADVRFGERYAFARTAITDWHYTEDGLLHGAYTLRVIVQHLPEEEADALRQELAPLPD